MEPRLLLAQSPQGTCYLSSYTLKANKWSLQVCLHQRILQHKSTQTVCLDQRSYLHKCQKDISIHLHTWPEDLTWDHQGPATQQRNFPINPTLELWSLPLNDLKFQAIKTQKENYITRVNSPFPGSLTHKCYHPTLTTYWTLFPLSAKSVWLKLLVWPSGINPMGILLKVAWRGRKQEQSFIVMVRKWGWTERHRCVHYDKVTDPGPASQPSFPHP